MITRINGVLYKIQHHPRTKMMVVPSTHWRDIWGLFGTSSFEEGAVSLWLRV
jgi:hypothetical protein